MSRRRSTSSTKASVPDRDVVMGPPPAPASTAPVQQSNQEINEKYRNLKRRFFELEEIHKETSTELQRSGERNVKMREERNVLLDRIIELESQYSFKSNGRSSLSPPVSSALAQPGSSALPRTLLGARARASFVANLREVVNDPDDDADPILTSRHIGPEARRRYEEQSRERPDQELHEPRRSGRNTRSSLAQAGPSSNKGKEPSTNEGDSPRHNASGSRLTPPVDSSSRGHSNHSSTQSHSHSHIHPPPLPPPRQQHHPTPRHHSLTPEQDVYRSRSLSPGSIDDMASGTPRPSDSRPIRGADTTSTQDNSSNDRHHTNRNVVHDGPTIGPDYSENASAEVPVPQLGARSRRESARTRRGVRNDHAAAPADDGRDQPESTRRTRSAAKRGTAAAPSGKTRATRRGNAAAAAEAKVKAAEIHEFENTPPTHHQPTLIPPSSDAPPPAPQPQDVVMDDPSSINDTAQKQADTPTTSLESASSHPSYLDPALASQSTRQTSDQRTTTPSTSTAGVGKLSEPSTTQPSPENIVRVAEAAIAAQNAANAALKQNNPPPQSTLQTTNGSPNGNGGASSTPTSAAIPSSATYNPYMILSAAASKSNGNGVAPGMSPSGMPVSHPLTIGMNPYALYYPPGMPMSPSTSAHPYANPYYHMPPMLGPNGVYPSSPSFTPPGGQRPSSDAPHQPKPKRLKAHTVTSKNFSIPMVPRDKSGKPMLPLNVGIMTVIKLGDVCMREHFHTERYIFPVGYEVSRRYLSTVDPSVEVVYHCTILDGGDGPKFQIIPSDVPDRPVIAGTATGAWSSIVKQANAIRNRQHSNSVSGPDFFGLGQNTIKHLIQELPNADRLRDYVWQRFVEGGPLGGRHAAVIPALPEEFDASHSVGALHYDKQKVASAIVTTSSPKGIYHYPQHIQQQAMQQQAQQQHQQQQQASSSQGPQPARAGSYYPDHQNHYPDHQSSGRTIRNPPSSANGDAPSGSARSTRVNTRSQVQQPQPSDGSTESDSSNAMPSTIATILNAYPCGGPGPHE